MDPEERGLRPQRTRASTGSPEHSGEPPGLDAELFRHYGRELVDWIADYYASIEDYPVRAQVTPGAVRAMLPPAAPEEPEPFARILADVDRVIMPGITHWQSPDFFAFFPANTSFPSILGELLSAGLGVQGMLWVTSPSCTELESHVLDWLVDLMDLPPPFKTTNAGGGVIQDSASSATLCAMLAGRDRLSDTGSTLTAYASEDAHSSVVKAAGIAGIGRESLRSVACDELRRMDVSDLRARIQLDVDRGHRPFFVCSTVGSTSTMAMDPLTEIAAVCNEYDLWMHVDGAMAGSAAICPEFRSMHRGLEHADSYCFNPHKWLLTNFDCDCFYVRDRKHLLNALSILPEYLRTPATETGGVIDYRDWQVPLGRRFRALKLWFTLRSFGARALRDHIRGHVEMARTFAGWIEDDSRFQLVVPPSLNLVCFRHKASDEVNETALQRINDSGRMYMTHTRVDGHYVLRMCIGQRTTTMDHVRSAWDLIREAFDSLD